MTRKKREADGIVHGVLNNFKGIEACVKSRVACCGCHGEPIGFIEGKVHFPTDGILQRYSFCSDCPTFVETSGECHCGEVEANFKKVTLTNLISGVHINDCKAFLSAHKVKPDCWKGVLVIETPCCQKIKIHGEFVGDVVVNRCVKCKEKKCCH